MTEDAVVPVVALVMAIGIAGTIVPLVPGLGLVAAAALGYGLIEGFGTIGVIACAAIVAMGGAGTAAGVVVPKRAAGAAGAARSSMLVGALVAVVGFFVVPVVGLPLGGALGVYLAERARLGSGDAAWRATKATIKGFGVAALLQFAAGLAMAATWVVWVLVD